MNGITCNYYVQEILMNDCGIILYEDDVCQDIKKELEKNIVLSKLELEGNEIEDDIYN